MQYFLRRLIGTIPVLFIVSIIVFMMIHLVPGDPAVIIAGPGRTGDELEVIRRNLGLTDPLYVQYLKWLSRVVQGDFGISWATRQPVLPQLLERFGNTFQLAATGILVASAIGLPIGIIAAHRRNSLVDMLVTITASIGVSMPIFWIGLIFVLVFAVKLGWLPAGGKAGWKSYVLPSVTIGINSAAIFARMTRSSMLEVIHQPYVQTARAKGLREYYIVLVHELRNAIIPVVTVISTQFGYLLGGAVLTETVFVWPGLGRLIVDAIYRRDFPVLQAGILLVATVFLAINLFADFIYIWLDPRIRLD
jgi:ABC-type dipeptide/oligopeptide/nickel transport system permease component